MDHDGEEESLAAPPRRSQRRQDRLRRQSDTNNDTIYQSLNITRDSLGARPRAKRPREVGFRKIQQGDSGCFVTTVTPTSDNHPGDLVTSDLSSDAIPVTTPSHLSTDESPRSPTIWVPSGKIHPARTFKGGPEQQVDYLIRTGISNVVFAMKQQLLH